MSNKKQKIRKYARYTTEIDGTPYALVKLPLGNGKYQPRTARIPDNAESKSQWAMHWAMQQKENHRNGKAPVATPRSRDEISTMTFTVLADWYKQHFCIAPVYDRSGKKVGGIRGYKEDINRINKLTEYFGIHRLDNISADLLKEYKMGRLSGKNAIQLSTLNRSFGIMKCMFEEAVERDWMRKNPFWSKRANLIDTALPPANNKKMTGRKAARLLARSRKSAQPLLHYLILTARFTGARPSELFPYKASADDGIKREPLIWKNILDHDFKKITLVSYKDKIRRTREVPVHERLEKGLREFYAKTRNPKPADLLFPRSSFKKAWGTLCRSARIDDVVMRDFRAFFNMELQDNPQVDEATRMHIMGHTSVRMNKHYVTHLSDRIVENYRSYQIPPSAIEVSAAVN